MRIDHIAYRVKDRVKTSEFFQKAFGYKVQEEIDLDFGEGKTAKCIALEPPEKVCENLPWVWEGWEIGNTLVDPLKTTKYHLPPEIFISDGSDDSIVGAWVIARGGIGGIHHIAYQVDSVDEIMKEWKEKGYAEFSTDDAIRCPGLTQVFTKPSVLTGIIYEFIERGKHGFCASNVKKLMISTS